MRKVIHIYKTYKPFTHGGVETYIDSILNYQGSEISTHSIGIGNNNIQIKKKYLKQVLQLILMLYLFNFCIFI